MVKALNCHDMYPSKVLCQGAKVAMVITLVYPCAPMCLCNVHVPMCTKVLVFSIHDQSLSCAVIATLENAICSGMKNASM